MNKKGTNILPVIGFIIMILVLFTGFLIFSNNQAITDADESIFKSTASKVREIGGYTVDEKGELITHGKDKISVEAVATNINIYTHTQDGVKAHLYGEVKTLNKEAVPYLELEEDGQTAVVRVKYPQTVNFFYYDDLKLDVFIPELWLNNLDISTASGNISAQKLPGADVTLINSSGDIKIQNIEGKYITVKTVSGKVELDALNAENGLLKSSSGDFLIGEAAFSDTFEVTTVSGKSRIDKLECIEGKFKSTSGDTEIKDVIAETVKSEAISGKIALK